MSHHEAHADPGHSLPCVREGEAVLSRQTTEQASDTSKELCKLCHRRKLSQHFHEREQPPISDCDCCPDTDMRVVEQHRPLKDCNTDHFHPPVALPRRKSSLSRMQRPDGGRSKHEDKDTDKDDVLPGFSPQAEAQYTKYKQSWSTLQSISMVDSSEARARQSNHDHMDGQGEFTKEIAALNGGWMDGTRHPGHTIP